MNAPEPPKRPDFIGVIVLVALLGAMALGFILFPMLKRSINYQDCVASGRTDCAVESGH